MDSFEPPQSLPPLSCLTPAPLMPLPALLRGADRYRGSQKGANGKERLAEEATGEALCETVRLLAVVDEVLNAIRAQATGLALPGDTPLVDRGDQSALVPRRWPSVLKEALNLKKDAQAYVAPGIVSSAVGAPEWDANWRPHLSPRGFALLEAVGREAVCDNNEPATRVVRVARRILAESLRPGEVIHLPMTSAEEAVLMSSEVPRSSVSVPGRSRRDVERWAVWKPPGATADRSPQKVARYLPGGAVSSHPRSLHGRRRRNVLDIIRSQQSCGSAAIGGGSPCGWVEREMLHERYKPVGWSTLAGGAVIDVKFNPDPWKRQLLVGTAGVGDGKEASLTNLETGEYRLLQAHGATVSDSTFSCTGHRAITAGFDHSICVWDPSLEPLSMEEEEEEISPMQDGERRLRNRRAVHPIYQLGKGGVMVHTRPQVRLTEGHTDTIHRLAVHPSPHRSSVVVSSSADKTVLAWDIDTGRCVAKLPRLTEDATMAGVSNESVNQVQDLAFCVSSYGEYLVGGCDVHEGSDDSGMVQVWDVSSGALISETMAHRYSSVSCLGASPSGALFLTGSEPPTLEDAKNALQRRDESCVSCMNLYDIRDTRSPLVRFLTGMYEHHVVSFSPCENYVQASGRDHRAVVYDRRMGGHGTRPLHVLVHDRMTGSAVEGLGVPCATWAHRSPVLVTGGEDSRVRVWDVRRADPLVLSMRGHQAPLSCVAISQDDFMIASGDDSYKTMLYANEDRYRLDCVYQPFVPFGRSTAGMTGELPPSMRL